MSLTLATPAAGSVLSLAELGDHLRLAYGFGGDAGAGGADDAAMTRCIASATAALERSLSTALLRQTWLWRFGRWTGRRDDPCAVVLPLRPVLAVPAISLIDAQGQVSAWDAVDWRYDPGDMSLRALVGAPPSPDGGFEVRFEAGHGDMAEDVPADLRHAVTLLAAHYFDHRFATDDGGAEAIPLGVEALLAPYRTPRLSTL